MSVWSDEYGVYKIGVIVCGMRVWILMLGGGHTIYYVQAHRIVGKRTEIICQHCLLHFCTVSLLVRVSI